MPRYRWMLLKYSRHITAHNTVLLVLISSNYGGYIYFVALRNTHVRHYKVNIIFISIHFRSMGRSLIRHRTLLFAQSVWRFSTNWRLKYSGHLNFRCYTALFSLVLLYQPVDFHCQFTNSCISRVGSPDLLTFIRKSHYLFWRNWYCFWC